MEYLLLPQTISEFSMKFLHLLPCSHQIISLICSTFTPLADSDPESPLHPLCIPHSWQPASFEKYTLTTKRLIVIKRTFLFIGPTSLELLTN